MSLRRFFPSASNNNPANNAAYQDFVNNQNNGFFQLDMDPTATQYNAVVSAIQGLGYSATGEGCDNPASIAHVDCYQSSTECPQTVTNEGCGVQTTPVDLYGCSNAGQNTSYTDIVNGVNGACATPADAGGGGLSALALGLIVGVPIGVVLLLFLACYLKSVCNRRPNPAGLFSQSGNASSADNQAGLNQPLANSNSAADNNLDEESANRIASPNRM